MYALCAQNALSAQQKQMPKCVTIIWRNVVSVHRCFFDGDDDDVDDIVLVIVVVFLASRHFAFSSTFIRNEHTYKKFQRYSPCPSEFRECMHGRCPTRRECLRKRKCPLPNELIAVYGRMDEFSVVRCDWNGSQWSDDFLSSIALRLCQGRLYWFQGELARSNECIRIVKMVCAKFRVISQWRADRRFNQSLDGIERKS